jgi:hypothetical protein
MNVHRFAIGQSVILRGTIGESRQTGHMFRVTGTMPPRDSSPQYRIRNEDEWHERVAAEDNLEEVKIGSFSRSCWSKRTRSPQIALGESYRIPLARITAISPMQMLSPGACKDDEKSPSERRSEQAGNAGSSPVPPTNRGFVQGLGRHT